MRLIIFMKQFNDIVSLYVKLGMYISNSTGQLFTGYTTCMYDVLIYDRFRLNIRE